MILSYHPELYEGFSCSYLVQFIMMLVIYRVRHNSVDKSTFFYKQVHESLHWLI